MSEIIPLQPDDPNAPKPEPKKVKKRSDRPDRSGVILNDDQKRKIIECWNSRPNDPPSLDELILLVWGLGPDNKPIDTRSVYGRLIREYLTTRSAKAPVMSQQKITYDYKLTHEDMEYIRANCKEKGPVEIARHLFQDSSLVGLSKECRVVVDYINTLPPEITGADVDQELSIGQYKAPKSYARLISRINRYTRIKLVEDKLTNKQKKELTKLSEYLHAYRFIKRVNSYDSYDDMELFESSFVRNVWDKADLEESEVDQYIMYAEEVVNSNRLGRNIEYWQRKLLKCGDNDEKLQTNIVNTLNNLQQSLKDSGIAQRKILHDLSGKRSERLDQKNKENNCVTNLVNLWKDEETRLKMIAIAEADNVSIGEEVERMMTASELISLVHGISKEEILNGTIA